MHFIYQLKQLFRVRKIENRVSLIRSMHLAKAFFLRQSCAVHCHQSSGLRSYLTGRRDFIG